MKRVNTLLISLALSSFTAGISFNWGMGVEVYLYLLAGLSPVIFMWRRDVGFLTVLAVVALLTTSIMTEKIDFWSPLINLLAFPAVFLSINLIESIRERKALIFVIPFVAVIVWLLTGADAYQFLFLMSISSLIYFWVASEGWFKKSIRIFPQLHFVILTLAGGLIAGGKIYGGGVLLSLLSIMCAWVFTISLNDLYDIEIDKISNPDRPLPSGQAKKWQYYEMSIMMGVFSIVLGLLCRSIFHSIIFLFLGFIYSTPPMRLRRFPLGSLFIAFGSIIAFHSGYFVVKEMLFDSEILKILIVMFLAFTFGIVIKDIKDVEGDKVAKVNTIFTVLGKERALRLMPLFLFIAFFSPLILIHSLKDIVIFGLLYISSVFLFLRFQNYLYVFPFYFIEFLYVLFMYI